ncbi:MAG: glycosyltransferase family 4 protein [Chitinispirillaceae bacterium]|nr:glycosyltransferase family 4 protein [Chitinispirillaceae bacterium]
MKMLLTLDFPPEIGGIQRYLYEIVKHTYTKDDIVLTIGKPIKEDLILPCSVKRVPIFFNKKFSLLLLLFLCLKYFLKEKNRITVFCGNIYSAIIPSILSRVFHIPYRIYCYGTELIGLKRKRFFLYLWTHTVFKRVEAIYYLSNTTKSLVDSLKIRCKTIENPPRIDLPDYKIEEKNYNRKEINILSVGRLVPHKGHFILIKALSLLKVNIKWNFKIIGNGPLYKKLLKEIEKFSLSKKVIIEKDVSDSQLKNYYIDADIFVLPSIESKSGIEGFGIVLLEAMAYGVPIIASQSGGIEDVFAGCPEAALLVPPGDSYELCKAIVKLAQDPELRRKMALKARKYLENKYVWK